MTVAMLMLNTVQSASKSLQRTINMKNWSLNCLTLEPQKPVPRYLLNFFFNIYVVASAIIVK